MTFKIKTRYNPKLSTPETMKLLRSTKSRITEDKNGENVPHLEITVVLLVHCNIINNGYQHDSRVLYTFVANNSFGSLLEISLKTHIFLKTFNLEFQEIKVWSRSRSVFTDQNSQPLEIEDKINLTLIIK